MRYFQHSTILSAAFLVFVFVYAPLRGLAFGMDAAFSATFTMLVFSYALRQRGLTLFSAEDAQPLSEILLGHAICLLALVFIVRTGSFASALLPGWFALPVIADNYGRLGPSAFQLTQSIALFFLGFMEVRLMTAPKKKDPREEERAQAALWRKAGLEADRLSGLRLP
jgi:hypothetical protein